MVRDRFFRSLGAKYIYLQGFEHADFVSLMWPLEAPGRSWEGFGRPPELQSGLWAAPGGLEGKGSGPGGLQEVPRTGKSGFVAVVVFPETLQTL